MASFKGAISNTRLFKAGEIIPDPILLPHKNVDLNNTKLTFIPIRLPGNIQIYIKTPPMVLNGGPAHYREYVPINTADGLLAQTISEMESSVVRILSSLEGQTVLRGIPKATREWYERIPGLRPTLKADRDVFFAKLAAHLICFDWHTDAQIDAPTEAGLYQFVLRVGNLYMGSHGGHPQCASLHIRVVQCRYKPLSFDNPPPIKRNLCLMQDEDMTSDDEMNSTPNLPGHHYDFLKEANKPTLQRQQSMVVNVDLDESADDLENDAQPFITPSAPPAEKPKPDARKVSRVAARFNKSVTVEQQKRKATPITK